MIIKRNKKGKISIEYLLAIVIIVLLAGVIISKFVWKIPEVSEKAKGLYDDGNCDGDNAINSLDKCPCIAASLEGKLRGCPLGFTQGKANRDFQTCKWYVTKLDSCGNLGATECYEKEEVAFVADCGKKNDNKCIEKSTKGYKTRCDYVTEQNSGVETGKIAGLAGKWDLTPKKIELYKDGTKPDTKPETKAETNTDGSATFNLESQKNSQQLRVEFEVQNVGEANIPKSFTVSVLVCDANRRKDSCKEKVSETLDPLNSQKMKKVSKTFTVGEKGDACDGEGNTQCTVRVLVDSKEDLGELYETNNDAWIFVNLKNKKIEQVNWGSNKFKSVEIFADEDEDKNTYTANVFSICGGFIGKDCHSEDEDCDDPGEHMEEFTSQGCLIHASEDNDGWTLRENDCGWAGVKAGFFFPYTSARKIRPNLVTPIINENNGVGDLFNYKWKSHPSGSLICNTDHYWYLCDKNVEEKTLPIGSERFFCNNDYNWEKIQ